MSDEIRDAFGEIIFSGDIVYYATRVSHGTSIVSAVYWNNFNNGSGRKIRLRVPADYKVKTPFDSSYTHNCRADNCRIRDIIKVSKEDLVLPRHEESIELRDFMIKQGKINLHKEGLSKILDANSDAFEKDILFGLGPPKL